MDVIDHQPTSVLDLLEDDSSHNSIGANFDTEEASERAYFVATPPPNDNGRGDKEAPNLEEEYLHQRQARLLAHKASLRQQQEELNTLIQKLDRIYNDVERRSLKAKRPRPRKVCDQLAKCSDSAQHFLNPTAALMLRSIPETGALEAKVMYQNLRNFVDRAAV